jgi:3-isopropylmalate/(R)-2-methylmalate dehydratase small subunit
MAKVVFLAGNDVSTDVIYPGRYMATVLPTETPQYAFADDKEFNTQLKGKRIPPGSIIIGGKNFGCGSSREQAVSTLKGHELVIIAEDFARIFLQNSINLGLHTIICPGIEASLGDELEISAHEVINITTGKKFSALPLPAARQAIINAGGLIAYTRKRLVDKLRAA